MKNFIAIALFALLLSGCSFFRVHKLDVVQGNHFTLADVDALHVGMSEENVKAIMGSPTLMNIFTPNRVTYIYTYQPSYGQRTEKRVICLFIQGRLQSIQRI